MKTSLKLINIQTFARFKEINLKTHKELLHPRIEKLTLQFKELYYLLLSRFLKAYPES